MERKHLVASIAVLALAGLVLAGCAGSQAPSGANTESAGGGGQQAGFVEYPIGDEIQKGGLNIAAVYFQPVEMEPADKAGLKINEADIHLEADIFALKDNETGFGFGEWVPYLTVKYRIKNLDNGQMQEGAFMPMNASDGPHYGANIKMSGAGKYGLTFIVESPEKQGYLLHIDRETGVPGRFWRQPIEVSWEFNYLPRKF
ncbi:MAG: iron transporter [Chloroflexi bacterium]|nr:iron transporter [Chloroflexota bacterium]